MPGGNVRRFGTCGSGVISHPRRFRAFDASARSTVKPSLRGLTLAWRLRAVAEAMEEETPEEAGMEEEAPAAAEEAPAPAEEEAPAAMEAEAPAAPPQPTEEDLFGADSD